MRVVQDMVEAECAAADASLSWTGMVRTLFILAVGGAIGYSYGYKDARRHEKTVYERVLDRAGAAARGKYVSLIEETADSVGH